MTNSNWQIHRVGLIDFWYYDEQEFYFIDGRMLLRGSNGSGKSVTMQSFIPLLLDGNMRPERLDPFGSRARKMENYLLEEDSQQEERTSYLFAEFKRIDNDHYVSIGIGLRARKNKKLESWYFCITDGRRIGKDFFLYKDMGNKIACTKMELRNRIKDGGAVMETQGEYAQCVNKLLFGFETMEAYKEMLDLLIQLRTPKLSKDFKPSIINDILSNSLQTLTEDDLRPMSEAVENMDSLKTNLSTLQDSVQAAKAIKRVYDQYNQAVLYDKAKAFTKEAELYQQSFKRTKELEQLLELTKKKIEAQHKYYEQLQQEEEVYKEEKKSLDASDAVGLKEKEQKLFKELMDNKESLLQKEKQEQDKVEKEKEIDRNIQQQDANCQVLSTEMELLLANMDSTLTDVPFDEFAFMQEELSSNKEGVFEFVPHIKMLKNYTQKVEDGIRILESERMFRDTYEACLQELDELQREQDKAERELLTFENQSHEVKGELTEAVFAWNKENKVLNTDNVTLQNICKQIQDYTFRTDYSEIKEQLRSIFYNKEDDIRKQRHQIEQEKETVELTYDELCAELKSWEEKKDPEPPQSNQVIKSRKLLEEQGIPYLQFYKTIDFIPMLSKEQADYVEEALLQMGMLDALLVSAEYRAQIMSLEKGVSDCYIFSDLSHIKENLESVFEVDNGDHDILLYQNISNVLSSIGYRGAGQHMMEEALDMSNTWISEQGHYKIGILEGTITKQYQAKYIGIRAREAYRNLQIEQLRTQKGELNTLLESIYSKLENLLMQENCLKKEWDTFPVDTDLKIAVALCSEQEHLLLNIRNSINRQQKKVEQERNKLDEVRIKVQEICSKTYLPVRYDVFQDTKEKLNCYKEELTELQIMHEKYLHEIKGKELQKDYLEEVQQDLDDIRYDLGKLIRVQREILLAKESVENQLKLTNYEEIKERLDCCIKRLSDLPRERDKAVRELTNLENQQQLLEKQVDDNQLEQVHVTERKRKLEQIFTKEYALGYVEKTYVITEDMLDQAKKISTIWSGGMTNKKVSDIASSLQESYHMHRGVLADYYLSMQSMFQELDEEQFLQLSIKRISITTKYRGATLSFLELLEKLEADMQEQIRLLSDKDRELFEDILANTISKKIRGKIQASKRWVDKMNQLMESMQTSSGLSLSLRWKHKRAEKEEQLDTRILVELLQKDVEIMRIEEVEQVAAHFRSKIQEARKVMEETDTVQSFHAVIKEVLDYRKWFEFQLEAQKTGEKKKELTDRVFFTFSGGEKAMAMYVPLFSAVVAKYAGARGDAPKMISLDEAFAGVDEMNIRDMFRLMVEFQFNFMINSQILWGDYDTVKSLAIYQLIRPENARFVSVLPHVWRGNVMKRVQSIGDKIVEEDQ